MKNNKGFAPILIVLMIVGVLVFGGGIYYFLGKNPQKSIGCTQEAKICPDGSAVGRTGPNCEFAECLSENNQTLSNFGNDQVEKAVMDYLSTQKHFSWETRADGHNYCVVENLNPENDLFPLYVWAYCGEFVVQNGELKTLSGSSGPVKINYPNELSFYDLNKFSYEAPGDGSHYSEDVKKIFPENVQQRIFNFNRENIIKRIEAIAIADNLAWESIKQAINNCQAEKTMQTHSKIVTVTLKNGNKLIATEPKIDDIIKIVEAAEANCGRIPIGTE